MLKTLVEEKKRLEQSLKDWSRSLQEAHALLEESKKQMWVHQGHLERINLMIQMIKNEKSSSVQDETKVEIRVEEPNVE